MKIGIFDRKDKSEPISNKEKVRIYTVCDGCSKENCMKILDFLVIFVSLSIPQGIVYHQHEVLHIIKTLVLQIIKPIVFLIHT